MICGEGIYLPVPSKSRMAGIMKSSCINDDHAVTVVFGTLLLILITITVASGIALMLSTMQKTAMEREEYRAAVANENIKVISIEPELETNSSQWKSAKLTLLNLNTEDSNIKAVSLNNVYATSYMMYNSSGIIDKRGDYPVMYNYNRVIKIPAQKTVALCLNFSTVTTNASEEINTSAWTNRSLNYTVKLNNNPRDVNPLSLFPESHCKCTLSNSSITEIPLNNYDIDLSEGNITLVGSLAGGTLTNVSTYTLNYNLTMKSFITSLSIRNNQPVQVKVMSSYLNTFQKFFTPPVPMAKANVYTEYRNGTIQNYLLLDASGSFDRDGYIVSYKWSLKDGTGNCSNLSGVMVRPGSLNLQNTPIIIDLELVDDTGMVSRISEVSGDIIIN